MPITDAISISGHSILIGAGGTTLKKSKSLQTPDFVWKSGVFLFPRNAKKRQYIPLSGGAKGGAERRTENPHLEGFLCVDLQCFAYQEGAHDFLLLHKQIKL